MCCNRCSGMEDRESSPMIMDVNRAAKKTAISARVSGLVNVCR